MFSGDVVKVARYVPRFPPSRSRGAAKSGAGPSRWRDTFSLIHLVLRKRTTQALTSPERSIDLAPCRLGGILVVSSLRHGEGLHSRKERKKKERKKNRYLPLPR